MRRDNVWYRSMRPKLEKVGLQWANFQVMRRTFRLCQSNNLAYGGSAISQAVLERTKRNLPNVRLMQAYGMTELSPVTTLLRFDDHEGAHIRSAGQAAPHSEVRILDADDNEVPRGTWGGTAPTAAT